jgi:hypothetical protein
LALGFFSRELVSSLPIRGSRRLAYLTVKIVAPLMGGPPIVASACACHGLGGREKK